MYKTTCTDGFFINEQLFAKVEAHAHIIEFQKPKHLQAHCIFYDSDIKSESS